MDVKAMLMNLAEAQADKIKEELATKINKKIDIPFVDEEKEQVFFEKCVDLVTDIVAGFFQGK